MRLYLLRHGPAQEADQAEPDASRHLTQEGAEEVRRFAGRLAHVGLRVQAVLSSPLTRAAQTAEIVAQALRPSTPLVLDPRLSPGLDVAVLVPVLDEWDGEDLLLVGHEPDLSGLIRGITGGRTHMVTTALARLELESTSPPTGMLAWLITPRALLGDEAPDHDFSHHESA